MIYNTDRKKQIVCIEGINYHPSDFCEKKVPDFSSKSDFHHQVYLFLKNWFSDAETLTVKTSGSTGTPKEMLVEKTRMMQSAIMTCDYLRLTKGDKVLLCMPINFIAGQMILVRSLVANLDLYLITPSGNPLKDIELPLDFAAMTPMQVFNCLSHPIEKERLKRIKKLIIGGGAISPDLEQKLHPFPNEIYSTYGMTETLSHIALRKLNGKDASPNYLPLPNVTVSISEESTLIIEAPLVTYQKLTTNDVAKINADGSFQIIGRKDNIINSGGIKIQIEEVERVLQTALNHSFAITSLPDSKFGEIVILVVENNSQIDKKKLENLLPNYSLPKEIIKINKIPLTETGKTDRASLKQLVKRLINKK